MAQETSVMKPVSTVYKIVLLGDEKVGKSCLLQRYLEGSFSESYKATIDFNCQLKTVSLPNSVEVKLQIWDTAGQKRYRDMARVLKITEVGCVVYDVTNLSTFENLQKHIKNKIKDPDAIIFIVGNKIEMETERQVTFDEGKKFADEMGYEYQEVSAAKNLNVDDMFMSMVKSVYRKRNPGSGSFTGLLSSANTLFKK